MSVGLRNYEIAPIAAFFLFVITICIPASAAGDASGPAPAVTLPLNDTSLFSTAGPGNRPPAIHHEPDPLITLLRLESNQTTFPGPRSMTFGPRYIELTANPRALLALAAGACIAGVAFVLYRRRKTMAETGGTREQPSENGVEKQE